MKKRKPGACFVEQDFPLRHPPQEEANTTACEKYLVRNYAEGEANFLAIEREKGREWCVLCLHTLVSQSRRKMQVSRV